jgi:hypothetical protein
MSEHAAPALIGGHEILLAHESESREGMRR